RDRARRDAETPGQLPQAQPALLSVGPQAGPDVFLERGPCRPPGRALRSLLRHRAIITLFCARSPLLDRAGYCSAMAELEFGGAVSGAPAGGPARDERVVFTGEDVPAAGGVFAVTPGLLEKYGPQRVIDTPISELALAGAAYGSAVTGLRPVVEIMFADFL